MSTSTKRNTYSIVRRTEHQHPRRTRLTHRILVAASNSKKAQLADSLLERDGLIRCEFCSQVRSYVAQPLTVLFTTSYGVIESTPDVEVTYVDGSTELLEIKYVEQYLRQKVRQKCRRVKDLFAANGIRYRVVTEKQIRRCPATLRNFRHLLGYRLDPFALPDIDWLQPGKEYVVADIANKIGSDVDVFRLVAQQKLICDLAQPLTLNTRVRKAKPADYADFI